MFQEVDILCAIYNLIENKVAKFQMQLKENFRHKEPNQFPHFTQQPATREHDSLLFFERTNENNNGKLKIIEGVCRMGSHFNIPFYGAISGVVLLKPPLVRLITGRGRYRRV